MQVRALAENTLAVLRRRGAAAAAAGAVADAPPGTAAARAAAAASKALSSSSPRRELPANPRGAVAEWFTALAAHLQRAQAAGAQGGVTLRDLLKKVWVSVWLQLVVCKWWVGT